MSLEIEIIRKEDLSVSTWSGGTTTQLAIYPQDALYSERNFKWRLSSAHVEVEESVFTSLPNINRIIMIIEGQVTLEHVGRYKSCLKPFQQDTFSGDWTTKSFGKVIDFNLMMSKDSKGNLEAIHLEKGQSKMISFDEINDSQLSTEAIYCVHGQIVIDINDNKFNLNEGDIILVTIKNVVEIYDFKVYNEKENKSNLIRTSILYK